KRAVLADRPLLHAVGVVDVIRIDGLAENSGEMRGDFRGAKKHIAGKMCLTAAARRAAIMPPRGLMRRWASLLDSRVALPAAASTTAGSGGRDEPEPVLVLS